jgi:hypothetical protein
MKDVGKADELEDLLSRWQTANVERLSATLHRDFVAFGCEEGLFIHADGPTFLCWARRSSLSSAVAAKIGWCDVHGALATASLIQESPDSVRMIVLTMLKSSEGWRVMTATFSVIDVASSNVALQVAVN